MKVNFFLSVCFFIILQSLPFGVGFGVVNGVGAGVGQFAKAKKRNEG